MVVSSNPTRGACQFPALWPFAEGLFILKYFTKKEGFLT
jgi:hypothetical protein